MTTYFLMSITIATSPDGTEIIGAAAAATITQINYIRRHFVFS